MNNQTKKSLIKKYSALKEDGKTDEEIRELLDRDNKIESKEDADGIMTTLSEEQEGSYIVVSPFRDKDNFDKKYEVKEDVSHFDKDRLNELVKGGHVKNVGGDE